MLASDYIKMSLVSALFIGIGIAIPFVELDVVTVLVAVTFAFLGGLFLGMLLIKADEEKKQWQRKKQSQ